MRLEDGLFIEDAGAVEVIHTSKGLRLPDGKNLTVFVELLPRHSDAVFKLPKAENSVENFVCLFLNVSSEDWNVTLDTSVPGSYITLDEPWDYVLMWSDGLQWNVLNYNYS